MTATNETTTRKEEDMRARVYKHRPEYDDDGDMWYCDESVCVETDAGHYHFTYRAWIEYTDRSHPPIIYHGPCDSSCGGVRYAKLNEREKALVWNHINKASKEHRSRAMSVMLISTLRS